LGWSRRLLVLVAKEPVLLLLAIALALLQAFHPRPWASLPALVDWQTVLTLAGLLILTKALESSGTLSWFAHRVVHRVVHRVHSERALACWLVTLAASLSTVLTNDVALFVVIPLMLSLDELAPLPLKRLVIFVALAVNAGSILTPLGNPQNLFLWQLSGVSFGHFVWSLAPLCAGLMALLYALTIASFKARPLDLSRDTVRQPVDRALAGVTAIFFAAFVMLADTHHAGIGFIGVACGFLIWRRSVVLKIDWLLLLIFVAMFVVLRSVAALPWVRETAAHVGLDTPLRVYMAGMVLSQGISNVPAAIVLAEFTKDWRALALGVSVGGFGIAIGSLANLIAMRLAKRRGIWLEFHCFSIPYWVAAGGLGAWLLSHL
jgi:Na+/H+ antiporter NhaD/arsenite permease-like protein